MAGGSDGAGGSGVGDGILAGPPADESDRFGDVVPGLVPEIGGIGGALGVVAAGPAGLAVGGTADGGVPGGCAGEAGDVSPGVTEEGAGVWAATGAAAITANPAPAINQGTGRIPAK